MATAKAVLKKDYKSKDETYPLKIRLQHKNKLVDHPTGYKILEKQFVGGIVKKHDEADVINGYVQDLLAKARKYFGDCVLNDRPIKLNKVFLKTGSANFADYILHRSGQYKAKGMVIMWQKLSRFEKELNECFDSKLFLDEVTTDNLRTFESYLVKNGNHANTIAKKFRFLKQLYQSAIDEGLHTGINPFKTYKIVTYPTKKEKLQLADIETIEKLDLTGPYQDARNLFLFSYYAKGARFENCIFLESIDIRNGRIFFKTNKGQKYISVLISAKLQKVLDQYPGKPFVFPYIKKHPADNFEYRQVKDSANSQVNKYLKVVGAMAEIKIPLTFHIARHSLAFHLKKTSASIHVIKDVLGHSDTRTTEIYLKGLDDEYLDEEMKKLYGE